MNLRNKNCILHITIFHNSTLCTFAVHPHEAYEVCIPLELYIFLVWGKFYIFLHLNLLGFYAELTDKFCRTFEGTTLLRDIGICYQSTRRYVSENFNNTTVVTSYLAPFFIFSLCQYAVYTMLCEQKI